MPGDVMVSVPEKELSWLEAFFGPGNAVRWLELKSGIVRPHWTQHILPWLRFLNDPGRHPFLVLPVFGAEGPVRWYGVAASPSALAQLTEELQGFIGPSYSTFSGMASELERNDPIEAALCHRFGRLAIVFGPRPDVPIGILEQQLLLYAKVLARRPRLVGRGRRPFGRIRADFDAALLAGNAEGAQEFLREIALTGRLAADQRRCFEIRLLAGLGDFERLARDHALLAAVIDLPIPAQTLVDIISSLYKTHVAPLVGAEASYAEISAVFKDRVSSRYGPLFRERKGIRHPDVLHSFLLYEAAAETADLERCESIISTYPVGAEGQAWAAQLVAWLRARSVSARPDAVSGVVESKETMARLAMGDEDFERAAPMCFDLLPSIWAFRSLLRCAVELGDRELANKVLGRVEHSDASVIQQFRPRDLEHLDGVRELASGIQRISPDAGWTSWAHWIEHDSPALALVQEVLKDGASKWSPGEYATQPEACVEFARLMGNSSARTEEIFRAAFPDIVDFFVERPVQPSRSFIPIYATLLKVLAWSGSATTDEMHLQIEVLRALLEVAPDRAVYVEAVEDTLEFLKANASPKRIDWVLEVCEVLASYPTQGQESRLKLFMEVAGKVASWAHRLTFAQRTVFRLLAQDYECPGVATDLPGADEEREAEAAAVDGNYNGLIAIYTLAERAGQCALKALSVLVPKAKILLNSDRVSTESLKSLARNADIFVFTWRRATHPAFYCVRDIRGLDRIVQPEGGGAASIVRAVVSALSLEQEVA
jgi:hypothetical protein